MFPCFVLAYDQLTGCTGSQRRFDSGALEADWMVSVAAALRKARRGLNDYVRGEI
jgi:hypothetical protein